MAELRGRRSLLDLLVIHDKFHAKEQRFTLITLYTKHKQKVLKTRFIHDEKLIRKITATNVMMI